MNEFKVGLFALATMAAIAVMSLKITTNQSGFGEHVVYRTVLKDASGIFAKTPIKIAGIPAGRILDISLDGINAHVLFEIKKSIPIPKGSRLRVNTVGFLGDKYLEIVLTNAAEYIPANGLIIAEDGPGLDKIIKQATEVMADIKEVTGGLKKILAPEGEKPPLQLIIDDVKETLANAREVTASLRRVINGNEDRLNNIVANLDEFTDKLNRELDKTDPDSTIADVKEVLRNAKKMTSDMEQMIADVRAGKGTLGKILVEEEIADEVKETLSGVKKIVNKVDSIRTELSMFTGVNSDYGSETIGNLKIFPSPERFYTLGVVTAPYGVERQRFMSTETDGGGRITELQRTKLKNWYRFNLQMGRRIHNWSFRGGMIESSGGIGVDYEWVQAATTFGLEVFDYRDDIGANVRLSADFRLWNVIFGRVALEDLIVDESRSGTVFVGLKFNDEDLKALIGFFL